MNHFHFPVDLGTVQVSWNHEDLLTHVQWSQTSLWGWRRVKVPRCIAQIVKQIQAFLDEGVPIQTVPWERLSRDSWSIFQNQVYSVLSEIPTGETRTYGWIAQQVGKPGAARAVGQALKRNPTPILLPCHRVCATNHIGGFMGKAYSLSPELQLKQRLLAMEENYKNPVFSFFDHLGSSQAWGLSPPPLRRRSCI